MPITYFILLIASIQEYEEFDYSEDSEDQFRGEDVDFSPAPVSLFSLYGLYAQNATALLFLNRPFFTAIQPYMEYCG